MKLVELMRWANFLPPDLAAQAAGLPHSPVSNQHDSPAASQAGAMSAPALALQRPRQRSSWHHDSSRTLGKRGGGLHRLQAAAESDGASAPPRHCYAAIGLLAIMHAAVARSILCLAFSLSLLAGSCCRRPLQAWCWGEQTRIPAELWAAMKGFGMAEETARA